jgi:hypothetical protein
MGADPRVVEPAAAYLGITMGGMVFHAPLLMCAFALQGAGLARAALMLSAIPALLHAALDPVLIFTLGLGAAGAAWAGVIAHAVGLGLAAMLLRQIQISHEARVATATFAANGLTAISATAAYTEANITSFNVPGDVAAAKLELAKFGVLPNTLVMSQPVFERIRRSTFVQNQFFGVVATNQSRLLNEAELAAAVGVDRVLVGRGAKNQAKKGQPYSGGFLWSNTYLALCNTVGGDFAGGGFGRTIIWAQDSPVPFVSETYRDEARRADVLRVRQNSAEKVIDGSSIIRITTGFA